MPLFPPVTKTVFMLMLDEIETKTRTKMRATLLAINMTYTTSNYSTVGYDGKI
jgi:hypothetical protein